MGIFSAVGHTGARQNCPPHSSSLGRKSRPAFAKAWFWQFRSQMAAELIT